MKIAYFCHSLVSDWNHGNAHFIRGLVTELILRGHDVQVFEPADAWSATNLVADHGELPYREFEQRYPLLRTHRYLPNEFCPSEAVDTCDLVMVHEWNDPALIRELGTLRRQSKGFSLLFHDTHHRSVSDVQGLSALGLESYDGVLAFGETVCEQYRRAGWSNRCWVFHEAADIRVFHPVASIARTEAIVWIGNYGDEERSAELHEYLFEPAGALGLKGIVYGVRYPQCALDAVERAGLQFGGWLPNFRVPEVMAKHLLTVHIPRRHYAESLKGIPTIRVFEALACGIPLICAPWEDSEQLFRQDDFIVVRSGRAMRDAMFDLLHDERARKEQAARGLRSILEKHTCSHRAEQLESIASALGVRNAYCSTPLEAVS
ncbi:MAG TPA: glycosyltransferase [Polyangiaceae bacterium]